MGSCDRALLLIVFIFGYSLFKLRRSSRCHVVHRINSVIHEYTDLRLRLHFTTAFEWFVFQIRLPNNVLLKVFSLAWLARWLPTCFTRAYFSAWVQQHVTWCHIIYIESHQSLITTLEPYGENTCTLFFLKENAPPPQGPQIRVFPSGGEVGVYPPPTGRKFHFCRQLIYFVLISRAEQTQMLVYIASRDTNNIQSKKSYTTLKMPRHFVWLYREIRARFINVFLYYILLGDATLPTTYNAVAKIETRKI